MQIELKTPLVLPKAWKYLLSIPNFWDLPKNEWPQRTGEADVKLGSFRHLTNPTPYRDDERNLASEEDGYLISYTIHSGENNYWLTREVFQKIDEEPLFSKGESSPVELKTGKDELTLENGDTLTIPIQIQMEEADFRKIFKETKPTKVSPHNVPTWFIMKTEHGDIYAYPATVPRRVGCGWASGPGIFYQYWKDNRWIGREQSHPFDSIKHFPPSI